VCSKGALLGYFSSNPFYYNGSQDALNSCALAITSLAHCESPSTPSDYSEKN